MSNIKGNLVVGQSGGPTAVINSSLVGVIHEALEHEEIGNVYGMLHGISGVLKEEFVDLRHESAETLGRLRNTPASALGTVRYKVSDADYERLIEVFQAYNVRYFCYIGGNDSADTTHKIHILAEKKGYELYAIGVPKTVDNDLAHTDHCPGYGSAARFVVNAIRDTGYDTEAMGASGPIKIMEVMGRNAGWLTAASALAKETPEDPPQLIYLPERGVSIEQVVEDVRYWYKKLGHCVLAVSEGMRNETGQDMGTIPGKVDVDAFGHARKGGVCEFLEDAIRDALGLRARIDKPSYLQRSFGTMISSVDREEAYMVGRAAVRAAAGGHTDVMVALERAPGAEYMVKTGLAPLAEVANFERTVPTEYINEQGNGVTPAFIEYARPLIGEPLMRYARLAKVSVPKILGKN
jgi:ATP-dependent phosphofructokinase / diphosphate-dependent phosphofructokinase